MANRLVMDGPTWRDIVRQIAEAKKQEKIDHIDKGHKLYLFTEDGSFRWVDDKTGEEWRCIDDRHKP